MTWPPSGSEATEPRRRRHPAASPAPGLSIRSARLLPPANRDIARTASLQDSHEGFGYRHRATTLHYDEATNKQTTGTALVVRLSHRGQPELVGRSTINRKPMPRQAVGWISAGATTLATRLSRG
jgi:hypothetical protein